MPEFSTTIVPRMLMLLVISPWIGVASIFAGKRQGDSRSGRQLALMNALVTATLASGLFLVQAVMIPNSMGEPNDQGRGAYAILAEWSRESPGAEVPPWGVQIGISIGIDALNSGPLLSIPWLVVAVILSMSPQTGVSRGRVMGLLAAEGLVLLQFAAQDAFTFCLAGEASLLAVWWLLASEGDRVQRESARAFFAIQHTGQLLWMFGLLGLALVGAWLLVESSDAPTMIVLSWDRLTLIIQRTLAEQSPRVAYWYGASGIIVTALLAGTVLRSGLLPTHRAFTETLPVADPSLAAFQLGALGFTGAYAMRRFVLPLLGTDSTAAWIVMVLGSMTALLGGLLVLAQSDFRRASAVWWVTISGGLWVSLVSTVSLAQVSAWLSLQVVTGIGSTLLILSGMIGQRYPTGPSNSIGGLSRRHPRLAVVGVLIIMGSMGLYPLWWGVSSFVESVAVFQQSPVVWGSVTAGTVLAGWSLVWLSLQMFFGPDGEREPAEAMQIVQDLDSAMRDDLTAREASSLLLAGIPPWLSFAGFVWGSWS